VNRRPAPVRRTLRVLLILLADIERVKIGLFPITLIAKGLNGSRAIESERMTKEMCVPEPE
jgi:hypothetical protein